MGKGVKTVWNIVTSILVLCALALAVLLAGPKLVGIHPFGVLTGSMEPSYPVGSLIYVKPVDAARLKSGDVITFLVDENNTTATHRIVEVVHDTDGKLRFLTKGDANDTVDPTLVLEDNVVGSPIATIPYLGRLAIHLQTKAGMLRVISISCILALLVIAPELLTRKKER